MKKLNKIVIADDHSLIRDGLLQLLEKNLTAKVFVAANGQEAFHLIKQELPEIAILDIEMPILTGIDVAKKVKEENMSTQLIFLTMFKDEHMFNKAIDLGIKGYVLKENTITEILQCIETVKKGEPYISPSCTSLLVKRVNRIMSDSQQLQGLELLTTTERKILKLLSEMKTNQQIGDLLNISVKTVQNHRGHICDKLGLHGAHALLKFALDNATSI